MFRPKAWLSIVATLLVARAAVADDFPVNPAATFLHTNNDPAPDALVIDLSKLSFPVHEGDTLRLERKGAFATKPGENETATAMIGVFSVTHTLLSSSRVARVTGAISAGTPFVTAPTQDDAQATDIVQDFLIDSGGVAAELQHTFIDIKVPNDAQYLFISAYATHYSTNTNAKGDYAVSVTRAPARAPTARGPAPTPTPTRTTPIAPSSPASAQPVSLAGSPILTNVTLFRTDATGANQGSNGPGGRVNHGEWTSVLDQQNVPGNYAAEFFLSTGPAPTPDDFLSPSAKLSVPLNLGENHFYFFGDGDDPAGGAAAFGINFYFNSAASSDPSISAFQKIGDQPLESNGSDLTGGFDCKTAPGANSLSWTSGEYTITLTSFQVTPSDQSSVDFVFSTNTAPFKHPTHPDGIPDTYGKFTLTVTRRAAQPVGPAVSAVAPPAPEPAADAQPAAAPAPPDTFTVTSNDGFLKGLLVGSIFGIFVLLILIGVLLYMILQKVRRPQPHFPPPTRRY